MTIGLLRDSTFLGQCNTRCNINLHDKCRSGHRMDTESRLSTEGKFYLGLNYRSEKPAIQVQGHANKMQPPGSR